MGQSFNRRTVIEASRALDDARASLRAMSGLNSLGTSIPPAMNNAHVAFESEDSLRRLVEKLREAGFGDLAAKVPRPIEKTAGFIGIDGVRAMEKIRAGKMCIKLSEIRRELDAQAPGVLDEDIPFRWMDAEGWAVIWGSPYFLPVLLLWNVAFIGAVYWWIP